MERCAKSFFLAKIARAPRTQSLWLAGGSAVHETTEVYDLRRLAGGDGTFSTEEVWHALFSDQLRQLRDKEPNENKWRRSSAEDVETWRRIGLQFVQSYIDWRERSPWEIWITPDGDPAIELDVSGHLPGCPAEIKGILDRVFHDPVFERLWVFDLKTGKRPPKNASQFRTYGALLRAKHGIAADYGVAFMNRKGSVANPHDLSDATPEAVGAVYGAAWEQIQSGEFPANGFPGECFICDVSAACAAKGGPLAAQYDPDHPDYIPF